MKGRLFLIYTREGAGNETVFRQRAPLFIAEVDPQRLSVLRSTEQIVLPNDGGLYGNSGICRFSESEAWITCADDGASVSSLRHRKRGRSRSPSYSSLMPAGTCRARWLSVRFRRSGIVSFRAAHSGEAPARCRRTQAAKRHFSRREGRSNEEHPPAVRNKQVSSASPPTPIQRRPAPDRPTPKPQPNVVAHLVGSGLFVMTHLVKQ